jgi:surface protein
MFNNCNNLNQLDLSNFNTSKVSNMEGMFYNCTNLTQLDISNFNFIKTPSVISMLSNTPNDMNIAMLYCPYDTVNSLNIKITSTKKTIWVKDTEASSYTKNENVTIKDYKEISSIINLTSPLYEGDKIVVKDDKLCHYHKMGMIVLDGSEDWELGYLNGNYNGYRLKGKEYYRDMSLICQTFITKLYTHYTHKSESAFIAAGESSVDKGGRLVISCSSPSVDEFKQWLQNNPTVVVYELTEPYYEDITPIQSQWVIESLEESNLDIITSLPIKVNMSYITNVPSLTTLSTRVSEVKESDNLIYNLTNMLDDEINQ